MTQRPLHTCWPCLASLLISSLFSAFVIHYEYHHLHEEDGLLERLQAIVLLATTLLFLWLPRPTLAAAASQLGLALLSFSFVLREVDVERLPLPDLLRTLGSGDGKRYLLGLLWGGLAAWLLHQQRRSIGLVRQLLRVPYLHLLVTALLFLLVSFVMDKKLLDFTYHQLLEEVAECNAYFLLLLAGFWLARGRWRGPQAH